MALREAYGVQRQDGVRLALPLHPSEHVWSFAMLVAKRCKIAAKDACYHCTTSPGVDLPGIEPGTSSNFFDVSNRGPPGLRSLILI